MEYRIIRNNDYLEHHGIKGQHWGVRRYQNEDNSLTPAGRERYRSDGGSESSGKSKIGTFVSKHKKGFAIAGGLLAAGVAAVAISQLVGNKSVQKGSEASKKILEEHKIALEVPRTNVPKVDTHMAKRNADRFKRNADKVIRKNQRAMDQFDRLNDEVMKKFWNH